MITKNVIYRTFRIRIDDSVGTCFTIDVADKQYIITARHVIENWPGIGKIKIFHEGRWKDVEVTLVGHCAGKIDISVLRADIQISPTHLLEPSMDKIIYGQDVYFLGFPYELIVEVDKINRGFPMPFVKKAILACLHLTEDDTKVLFLDGYNNPGFSGGPVIFKEGNSSTFKVAGVISSYIQEKKSIYQGNQPIPLVYQDNTGIIIAYGIQHAVDIIDQNPIGFNLKA